MKNSYLIIGALAFLAVSGIAYASFSENKAKEMMVKAEAEKVLMQEMENEKMMKEEEMKKMEEETMMKDHEMMEDKDTMTEDKMMEEHDKMDGAM